jgi:F-type H+-transporting ATPase subunit delta
MKNKLVAQVYATALLGLGEKEKIIEDIQNFITILNDSNELENVLFLEVFKPEEKKNLIESINQKASFTDSFFNFLNYLIDEKRINLITQIYKETILAEEKATGIVKGVIEGHEDSINTEILEKIKKFTEQKIGVKTNLEYLKNENIIAGFRISIGDHLLDATVDNQLEQFKKEVSIN